MLELQNVHVRYGPIEALHGISLRVAAGTIVTLIGGNGAGKSTTLRTISGLLTPTAGRITFEGRPIHGRSPHEILGLGIGHVPEGRQVFPTLTVWENLRLGAFREGRAHEVTERLEAVFQEFPVLHERARQLGLRGAAFPWRTITGADSAGRGFRAAPAPRRAPRTCSW